MKKGNIIRIPTMTCIFSVCFMGFLNAQPVQLSLPWSSGLSWLEISPHDSDLMIGGARLYNGVGNFDFQVSRDGGLNWTNEIGQLPLPDSSRVVNAIFDDVSSDTIWLLTETRGGTSNLLRSVDSGQNYSICQNGIEDSHPYSLFQSPSTRQLFLISRIRDSLQDTYLGIYTSINGGDTWTSCETNQDTIWSMVFAPSNPNQVYAIVGMNKRLAVSYDGGLNWSVRNLEVDTFYDLTVDPDDEDHILFQYIDFIGSTIYLFESIDAGLTAENIQVYGNMGASQLWVSPDWGLFFNQMGRVLQVSDDFGFSWRQIANNLPWRRPDDDGEYTWCIQQDPSQLERIFLTNPRGLFVSDDTFQTAQYIGNGLGIGRIRDLVVDPFNSNQYAAIAEWNQWAGSVENEEITPVGHSIMLNMQLDSWGSDRIYYCGEGLDFSDDGGETIQVMVPHTLVYGVRITQIKVHPTNIDIIYFVTNFGEFVRSNNRGVSWNEVNVESDHNYYTLAVDQDLPDRVWLGCSSGLYLSDSQGGSWETVTDTLFPEILVPVGGMETVFLITHDNLVLRSQDDCESFEDITPEGLDGEIVDGKMLRNETVAIVTSDRFYTMPLDGETWEVTSWPDLSGITCFEFLPDRHGLLVGTESTGIWRVDDVPWVSVGDNLTHFIVPLKYSMLTAYPNPFNCTTIIPFTLPIDGHTTLTVFDVLGRQVDRLIDTDLKAGEHRAIWNTSSTKGSPASSVYFLRLETPQGEQTHRITLVK